MSVARTANVRLRPLGMILNRAAAAATVIMPSSNPKITLMPPADQASSTGAIEINTVARPPSATNPIIPTLKSPAKPHCRFTPSAMIALIKPMFKMSNAVFQLLIKPVMTINPATIAKSAMFLNCCIRTPFL